jgi:hypothetical protein
MKTSQGLIELLIRLGITPTLDSAKDVELARVVMAKPFDKTKLGE